MVLAQKQKYRSMEQDRKPGDKPVRLKDDQDTKKNCLTSFLMANHYRMGFLDPNEAGRGSLRPDHVRSSLYKFVARDGQVNGRGFG